MALPIIQTPTYSCELKSLKKRIEFRPFLVKEQTILLIALETDDIEQIFTAFKQIIKACIISDISIESLPAFELEYLFLQIAARSAGEMSEVIIHCDECNEENLVKINLLDASIKGSDPASQKIQLTSDIGIKLKYPGINAAMDLVRITSNDSYLNDREGIIKLISSAIDFIYDSNKIYKKEDTTAAELEEFIKSLTISQMKMIIEYLNSMPYLALDTKFECKKCKKKNEKSIRGIKSFFG